MSKVVLFGSGRGADVAYRFLIRDSEHQVVAFAPESAYVTSKEKYGLPVVPFEDVENRFPPGEHKFFVLLGYEGMNGLRAEKYAAVKAKGYSCVSYVNSHFFRAGDVTVGENCFILDKQSISLDVKIGSNVVMWSGNHVGDMSTIGDHVWLASHVTIAAEVDVQPYSFVGIGATVGNRVTIGARSFIGANALVSQSTPEDSVSVAPAAERVDLRSADFMRVMALKGAL